MQKLWRLMAVWVGGFGLAFLLIQFVENRIENFLLEEIFSQESVVSPAFPREEWNRNQVQIRPWKRKRGDYVIEADNGKKPIKRWTLNQYSKELVEW